MIPPEALVDLATAVLDAERRSHPGVLIEAGTALGGSGIVMASAKRSERDLFIYDVFGQIPPPTAEDGADVHARYAEIASGRASGIGGETYYGYRNDLLREVTTNFERMGYQVSAHAVHLIPGLFQDTLVGGSPVALAHIDGDWYQSVMTCLRRLTPRLTAGGRLVIDDYDAWSGCRRAVDEFLSSPEGRVLRRERHARLHLVHDG